MDMPIIDETPQNTMAARTNFAQRSAKDDKTCIPYVHHIAFGVSAYLAKKVA